jgi:hypothetical protein
VENIFPFHFDFSFHFLKKKKGGPQTWLIRHGHLDSINGHASKNPVILRIEFRTWLKSRPLRVRPLPVHTEKAIFPAILRPMMTCGGTTSPSSDSSSRWSSLSVRWNIILLSGIFTGTELAILFSFFSQYLLDAAARVMLRS